jgi:hypothetical protein
MILNKLGRDKFSRYGFYSFKNILSITVSIKLIIFKMKLGRDKIKIDSLIIYEIGYK